MSCQNANTGIKVQVSSKSANIAFGLTVSGTGITRTIAIQTDTAGSYLFRVWLVDAETDRVISVVNPSGENATEWWIESDSDGSLTKTITHDGTRDWYPKAVLIGPVATGDVLSFT